jgi:hypothetical protein
MWKSHMDFIPSEIRESIERLKIYIFIFGRKGEKQRDRNLYLPPPCAHLEAIFLFLACLYLKM